MLYNLCEWPSRKGSRLAVIGIANTLDLPERLMPRIASRLGSRRVVFQPYRREQLQAIVAARLADAGVTDAFEENAMKYAASKASETDCSSYSPVDTAPAAIDHVQESARPHALLQARCIM